jgi:transcriptional regulator with XRE-family HTH domain
VDIGNRLRELREATRLSQCEVAGRSGLLRHHISRVENGHVTPSLPVVERWAAALELELYQFSSLGLGSPKPLHYRKGFPSGLTSRHFWRSMASCRSKIEHC